MIFRRTCHFYIAGFDTLHIKNLGVLILAFSKF